MTDFFTVNSWVAVAYNVGFFIGRVVQVKTQEKILVDVLEKEK